MLLVSVDFRSEWKTALIPFVKKKQIKSEVYLLNETDQQEFINRVDPSWSGAIPATLFVKAKQRKFFEKEFSYPELLTEYKNMQL